MTCGIYKIEAKCPVAKKMGVAIYIGQSKNIEGRWKVHVKKYPESQYDYEVLLKCDVQFLDFFEKAFISGYDSHRWGLNKTIGGTSIKTQFPDKDTRKKTSESMKGNKNPNFGKTFSEETRKNMSDGQKGKKIGPRSEEHKAKLSAANKGKKIGPMSEEQKEKLSAANKGKKLSEETRAKISDARRGKPKPQVQCPHCGKTGRINGMKRWHFANCSSKPITFSP